MEGGKLFARECPVCVPVLHPPTPLNTVYAIYDFQAERTVQAVVVGRRGEGETEKASLSRPSGCLWVSFEPSLLLHWHMYEERKGWMGLKMWDQI